jgi:hypothetical protein
MITISPMVLQDISKEVRAEAERINEQKWQEWQNAWKDFQRNA